MQLGPQLAVGDMSHFEHFVDDALIDMYATGGDVIMDSNGNILYNYQSKTMYDRPTALDVLNAVPAEVKNAAKNGSKKVSFGSSETKSNGEGGISEKQCNSHSLRLCVCACTLL